MEGALQELEETAYWLEVLVEAGLAACVNILPGMISIYVWEGKRHRDAETVMIIKTRRELAERVIAEVRSRHSYENPALLALSADGGSQAFIDWIVSPEGQNVIASYKINGEQLFFPNAE